MSGVVAAAPVLNWGLVDAALRYGNRGLPGGSSLARVLLRHRKVFAGKDRLDEDQIFGWAKNHFRRTGQWPQSTDGAIPESSDMSWSGIDVAMRNGSRGLPGGSSLNKFLFDRGAIGPERRHRRPLLTPDQIWKWAKAHHRRHGAWPRYNSGPIDGTDGETWYKVDCALRTGLRGLPAGLKLAELLESRGADL
jgi:hypothetical protein